MWGGGKLNMICCCTVVYGAAEMYIWSRLAPSVKIKGLSVCPYKLLSFTSQSNALENSRNSLEGKLTSVCLKVKWNTTLDWIWLIEQKRWNLYIYHNNGIIADSLVTIIVYRKSGIVTALHHIMYVNAIWLKCQSIYIKSLVTCPGVWEIC